MWKKTIISISIFTLLFTFVSCNPIIPKDEPDLDINLDISQLNTTISLSAPASINSFEVDQEIKLELSNISDQQVKFRFTDIQIFTIENDQWKKINDLLKNIIVDNLQSDWENNNTNEYLTLKPKGIFPGDKRIIGVLPDLESEGKVYLRIYVIATAIDTEKDIQNTVGAFIDVSLNP